MSMIYDHKDNEMHHEGFRKFIRHEFNGTELKILYSRSTAQAPYSLQIHITLPNKNPIMFAMDDMDKRDLLAFLASCMEK